MRKPVNEPKNILSDFLIQPRFRMWRNMLFIVAFIPIALSQSFFAFGSHSEIQISTIYYFGAGITAYVIAFVCLNIYYLVPHFLPKGEYATYIIVLLLSVSGFVLVKYIVEYQVFLNAGIIREINSVTVLDGLSNSMLYTICIAGSSITILFRQWVADSAKIESLENKQLKNSIDEIKNRINPQFLYATLDYASKKVTSEPEQTSETLFMLSELLSYQLYDCGRNKILLESDIEFIRNYLMLEQQNSGSRFTYTISVIGETNKFIPPGLFMPWIEEVIRQQPVALFVNFKVDDCCIKFECTAGEVDLSLCDFQKTKQRLELLYGHDVTINIKIGVIALQFKICCTK